MPRDTLMMAGEACFFLSIAIAALPVWESRKQDGPSSYSSRAYHFGHKTCGFSFSLANHPLRILPGFKSFVQAQTADMGVSAVPMCLGDLPRDAEELITCVAMAMAASVPRPKSERTSKSTGKILKG